MSDGFASFREFYEFYLGEHRNPICRRLHFAGSSLALGFVLLAVLRGDPRWLMASLLSGYAFAWVGHFFFEHNRPATFKHPFYSFAGDWVMFKDILIGKIPF
ncbi:Mpo1-like protein [Thermomonas sp.]